MYFKVLHLCQMVQDHFCIPTHTDTKAYNATGHTFFSVWVYLKMVAHRNKQLEGYRNLVFLQKSFFKDTFGILDIKETASFKTINKLSD